MPYLKINICASLTYDTEDGPRFSGTNLPAHLPFNSHPLAWAGAADLLYMDCGASLS